MKANAKTCHIHRNISDVVQRGTAKCTAAFSSVAQEYQMESNNEKMPAGGCVVVKANKMVVVGERKTVTFFSDQSFIIWG